MSQSRPLPSNSNQGPRVERLNWHPSNDHSPPTFPESIKRNMAARAPTVTPTGDHPARQNSMVMQFSIMVRIQGREGLDHIRFRFRPLIDTYDTLFNVVVEKYTEMAGKAINIDDFTITTTDVSDESWPIVLKNTKDLELAINSSSMAKGFIKVFAQISPKNCVLPSLPVNVANASFTAVSESSISAPPAVLSAPSVRTPVGAKPKAQARKKQTSKHSIPRAIVKGSKLSVRSRIIKSVAELHALGQKNVPRIQCALFAGYSNPCSKGFSNPLSSLKTEGILCYPDKKSVALTPLGQNEPEAKAISPPTSNREVHDRMKALLTPKQIEIFDCLVDGAAHERNVVAGNVGYSNPASKGYSNSVGKMSSLGIVIYPKDEFNPKKKLVQLSAMCFPFVENGSAPSAYRAPTTPQDQTNLNDDDENENDWDQNDMNDDDDEEEEEEEVVEEEDDEGNNEDEDRETENENNPPTIPPAQANLNAGIRNERSAANRPPNNLPTIPPAHTNLNAGIRNERSATNRHPNNLPTIPPAQTNLNAGIRNEWPATNRHPNNLPTIPPAQTNLNGGNKMQWTPRYPAQPPQPAQTNLNGGNKIQWTPRYPVQAPRPDQTISKDQTIADDERSF